MVGGELEFCSGCYRTPLEIPGLEKMPQLVTFIAASGCGMEGGPWRWRESAAGLERACEGRGWHCREKPEFKAQKPLDGVGLM